MLVVNAGNANAFTGEMGRQACRDIVAAAAAELGCSADQIFVASTGAIGLDFDPAPIVAHIPALVRDAAGHGWERASRAIMTTDTFAKVASATARLGGVDVTVSGMAKGAGMIAPDMATMLGFIATDAPVDATVLQQLLKAEVDRTFNAITVDSDTSTNDTVMMFATGAAAQRGAPRLTNATGADARAFALRWPTCSRILPSRSSRTARATTS
jgi:glutamate N-acetyltransferase/amino-acid N-acetyltransferase